MGSTASRVGETEQIDQKNRTKTVQNHTQAAFFEKNRRRVGFIARFFSSLLGRLDAARGPGDMNVPGWKLHSLRGTLQGHIAVWVSGNWRLIFAFEDGDAILVNYVDYH